MSLKSFIMPRLIERMLSEDRLNAARREFEKKRAKNGEPHKAEFFHDPSDPYSQLLAKVLPEFQAKYNIELVTHIVSPPDDGAAPERNKLADYARKDAVQLASHAGVDFSIEDKVEDNHAASGTAGADKRRKELGHYMGGMIYYGGEWYWGLDRLHYLETRLQDLGLQTQGKSVPIYSPPVRPESRGDTGGVELHCYLSFRSPYSAIIRGRVKKLAQAYGATLKLRMVLPMVMRGLPVSPAKKKYILFDTVREARRFDVPFGRIMDPVGRPVEIAYSLMPWAREQGKDYDYANSWLTAVWSEGVNAGSEKGLQKIIERAGLDWRAAKDIVGNDDWRSEAEANRNEMMDYGIWGVPSFRIGETITWGQDRLWLVEKMLQEHVKK